MDVNVSQCLEPFIRDQLASGAFNSAEEVVATALELLRDLSEVQDARRQALRREIDKGLQQLDEGAYLVYDDASLRTMFDAIKERGRRRMAEQKRSSA